MDLEIKEEAGFTYLEQGNGPVMIVLHGLFGALSNFRDVVEHFCTKYTVVIPMMPIYELPVINTNVKNLTGFIRDFVKFKGYNKIHLLGNSLGGHVALVYTSKYKSSVKSLTLTGSSGLYENAMGGSFPRREDYEYIKQKVDLTFFDPKHATKELVDECFKIVNDRAKVVRTLALAKSAIRHNMAKELPYLNVPTCLIWGKNDTITPPEVAEEFHELLPQSDLYWIDECGHAPMMEQPEQFNTIYEKWLSDKFA